MALVLGGSYASGATSADDHPQTIVVVSSTTSFHFIDVGPVGASSGDSTTFTKVLKNAGGTVVGFGQGSCALIVVKKGNPESAECQQTFRFDRDTIQVDGLDHLIEPQKFAIVGGTGRFRHAQGQFIAGGGPNGADIFEISL